MKLAQHKKICELQGFKEINITKRTSLGLIVVSYELLASCYQRSCVQVSSSNPKIWKILCDCLIAVSLIFFVNFTIP